jgi:DNA modification methylase
MTPALQTVKLSQVVFDESVYPRQKHDPQLVQRYAECLEEIEARQNYISVASDMRLVDGRHRHLAYLTLFRDQGDREIPVFVYPVTNDDEVFDLAAELNSTAGWQMTDEDKRRAAVKMYTRVNRKSQEEIAKTLSVRLAVVNRWLGAILKQEQEERETKMYDMYMACHTQEAIAEAVGVSQPMVSEFLRKISESFRGKDSDIFRNFEPKIYNVWSFPEATNQVRHFGNIPPEIIDNLLYYYTKPFDVVFDPFGGGGSTIDKCLERKRRYYVSDLNPIPARADIRKHDITTGLPDDLPVPDLVFLDPPYWKQAEGRYSNDPTDLGNVDLEAFLGVIADIAKAVKRKWSNNHEGKLALIIGPYKHEGQYTDLALLCYERISKYLNLVMRVSVPYSTQVHGGAFVKMAKEKREILYLTRDLMIFGR